MGLATFNRNRGLKAAEATRPAAPRPAPRTTEQALREEHAQLEAELGRARARVVELEAELEALTAPKGPVEPKQDPAAERRRGGR